MVKKTLTPFTFRAILRYYWPFVVKYRTSQFTLLAAFGSAGLMTVVWTRLLYKDLIDVVSVSGPEAYTTALWLVFSIALSIVIYNIGFRIGDYVMVVSQSKILKDLADHAHEKLQEKSYEFYTNTFAGSLIAKTRRFVNAFETLQDQFVFQIWMSGLQLLASIAVLWIESTTLGLIVLCWLVLYIVLVRYLVAWQMPKSLLNAEMDTRTTAHYSDIISNILTVKMFGASKPEMESFAQTTNTQEKARRAAWLQQNFWNSLIQGIVVGVFEIVIMGVAVVLWHQGAITPGTIVLVQVSVIFIFNAVWQLSKNVIRISTALTDAHEMVEILTTPAGVKDRVDPERVRFTEGKIVFISVSHKYNGGAGKIFESLSLTIPAGQRVAFVGHSGAGKTTIVKLLLRFLDLEKGVIQIDGQNIADVPQNELRKHIAYVPQEPILFHRTLRENIAYGKPEATDEEVREVAHRAHAHEFIERLPNGYDTLVGERGIKLSGGERQRVAIARALLKDAPVVILDEATSSLDSLSERHIQAAFDELMKGRTTIVIAHRLSTIQHMDRIIVLERGQVREDGTHAELLAGSGIYAELWNSQVGGFLQE